LLKENIRAVACGFHEGIIVFNDRVEIAVIRSIGTGALILLANPARAIDCADYEWVKSASLSTYAYSKADLHVVAKLQG